MSKGREGKGDGKETEDTENECNCEGETSKERKEKRWERRGKWNIKRKNESCWEWKERFKGREGRMGKGGESLLGI